VFLKILLKQMIIHNKGKNNLGQLSVQLGFFGVINPDKKSNQRH
jgi:hypothetical protein